MSAAPVIEVANDHDECKTCIAERDRVLPPQVCGSPRQPFGFGNFLFAIGNPAEPFALQVAPRRHAIGRSEIGVELDGPGEQRKRLLVGSAW